MSVLVRKVDHVHKWRVGLYWLMHDGPWTLWLVYYVPQLALSLDLDRIETVYPVQLRLKRSVPGILTMYLENTKTVSSYTSKITSLIEFVCYNLTIKRQKAKVDLRQVANYLVTSLSHLLDFSDLYSWFHRNHSYPLKRTPFTEWITKKRLL